MTHLLQSKLEQSSVIKLLLKCPGVVPKLLTLDIAIINALFSLPPSETSKEIALILFESMTEAEIDNQLKCCPIANRYHPDFLSAKKNLATKIAWSSTCMEITKPLASDIMNNLVFPMCFAPHYASQLKEAVLADANKLKECYFTERSLKRRKPETYTDPEVMPEVDEEQVKRLRTT